MVVWSAARPRSRSNSSTSPYESENRRYQRTAQTMISGSKCRHLNSAGRGLIMEYTAAYQTRSRSFCNTAVKTAGSSVYLPGSCDVSHVCQGRSNGFRVYYCPSEDSKLKLG